MVVVINAVPVTRSGLTSRTVFDYIIDRYIPADVDDTIPLRSQQPRCEVLADVMRVTLGDHQLTTLPFMTLSLFMLFWRSFIPLSNYVCSDDDGAGR